MNSDQLKRCEWAKTSPLMIDYHDREWGTPVTGSQKLFEFLILEGAQAGLSWSTILNKRENYRLALDQFDPEKIARYDQKKIDQLMQNAGIVRNRLKIQATISNAQAFLALEESGVFFSHFIWQFVEGKPLQNEFHTLDDLPAFTELSLKMSKELKSRGFKFVGSTICYAFMQAVGLVNDHTVSCFRHHPINDMNFILE